MLSHRLLRNHAGLALIGDYGTLRLLHEIVHDVNERSPIDTPKRPRGPGAPPKHDWDAFAGAIARRVHDHGMPASQGELVRDRMESFAGREDFPPPDERTVRQKVSAIWRELWTDQC